MIAAVLVPPSACITSQSIRTCRSPRAFVSVTALKDLPISRCISSVRPLCFPLAASRSVRVCVDLGSMPYSAVIQPIPWPLKNGGTRSSTVAVQSTCVSPNLIKQDPSAYFENPISAETGRFSLCLRPEGLFISTTIMRNLRTGN